MIYEWYYLKLLYLQGRHRSPENPSLQAPIHKPVLTSHSVAFKLPLIWHLHPRKKSHYSNTYTIFALVLVIPNFIFLLFSPIRKNNKLYQKNTFNYLDMYLHKNQTCKIQYIDLCLAYKYFPPCGLLHCIYTL